MNSGITLMTFFKTIDIPTKSKTDIKTIDLEFRSLTNENFLVNANIECPLFVPKQISINGIIQKGKILSSYWFTIEPLLNGFFISTVSMVSPIYNFNEYKIIIKETERNYEINIVKK